MSDPNAPTARDLAEATDITRFLVSGSAFPEQPAGEQMLGDVGPTSYEIPVSVFRYDQDLNRELFDQVFGDPPLIWVYIGRQCIGSLQMVDGNHVFFPLTLLWEGDQA